MKVMLGLIVASAAMVAAAEKQPMERYQPIIDRQMFGRVPAGFDPTKPLSTMTNEDLKKLEEQQEQLKSAIRLSAINIKPSGRVAVGFTDSGVPSKPAHYYLEVNESRDGWLVKEADPETAVAVIAKGEVEITLTLGEDSAKKADATARAGQQKDIPAVVATELEEKEVPRSMNERRERRLRRQQEAAEAKARYERDTAEQRAKNEELKAGLEDLREQLLQTRQEQQQQSGTETVNGEENAGN